MKELKKKVIITIISLVIVAIAVSAYIYIYTDTFKSSEQLFGKYLLDNINQLESFNLKPYNEIIEKLVTQNSETEITVDYTYTPEETEEPLLQNINTNVIATLNIKSDVKNKKQSMTLKTNSNQKELVLLSTLSNENTAGVKVEELYDKYLTLENRELKTFFSKIGFSEEELEDIPNKIETPKIEKFTPEELDRIEKLKDKYFKKITDPIDKTCYSKEKKIQIDVNDENITADKYVLTINEKSFATILTTTIKAFLADQEFLNLYEGRITDEQIKNLEEQNDKYIKELENIDENSQINIIVYVKDKKTVRTDYISESQQFSFQIINDLQGSSIKIVINQDETEELNISSENIIKITNTSSENSGELNCEVFVTYDKNDIDSLNSEINNSYGYENYYEETFKDQNLKFTLTTKNINENNINLNLASENIKIDCNIDFKDDVPVEEFTDENAIILNDYSALQLENLTKELMENGVNSITRNLNSNINPVVTIFVGMYMASFSNEDSAVQDNYLTNTTNTISNTANNTVTNNTVAENIITRNMIDYMFTNTTNTATNSTTSNTLNNNITENTTTNNTSNMTNTTENRTNTSKDSNTANNITNDV